MLDYYYEIKYSVEIKKPLVIQEVVQFFFIDMETADNNINLRLATVVRQ